MKKQQLPYLNAGLFFAAGCIGLAVPGPGKYVATPLFFIAAVINLVVVPKSKK